MGYHLVKNLSITSRWTSSILSDFYLVFLSCALGWRRGRDSLSSLAINKDDLNNHAGSKIFLIICLEYVHHVCSGGSCLDSCLTQRRSLNINTSVFGLASCQYKTVFLIPKVLVLVLFNSDYPSWPQGGVIWPPCDLHGTSIWPPYDLHMTWKYMNAYHAEILYVIWDSTNI